ncbi:MAG: hypothetical protein HND48_23095 [Chloroflexi bacterium]|nr:hypothetical protein [Chloroflexota bacterium]
MSAPPAPRTVKALDATGRIGGYLAVWGSADQRDLQDEYFTPATDFGLDWYETRPVLYQHALDDAIKTAALGVIDTLRKDDVGLWAEAQLDKRNRYVQAVLDLIARGALKLEQRQHAAFGEDRAGRLHRAMGDRRRQLDPHAGRTPADRRAYPESGDYRPDSTRTWRTDERHAWITPDRTDLPYAEAPAVRRG